MKTKLLVASFFLFSFQAFSASNIECVAKSIYGGPLEESFSVEEYPEVSISAASVSLGASRYSKSGGDSITMRSTAAQTSVTIVTKDQSEQFTIVIDKRTKKGTVSYNTADESEDMATIVCK